MPDFTSAARAAQDEARRADGKFGHQPHPEVGQVGGLSLSEPVDHRVVGVFVSRAVEASLRARDRSFPGTGDELADMKHYGEAVGHAQVAAAASGPEFTFDVEHRAQWLCTQQMSSYTPARAEQITHELLRVGASGPRGSAVTRGDYRESAKRLLALAVQSRTAYRHLFYRNGQLDQASSIEDPETAYEIALSRTLTHGAAKMLTPDDEQRGLDDGTTLFAKIRAGETDVNAMLAALEHA